MIDNLSKYCVSTEPTKESKDSSEAASIVMPLLVVDIVGDCLLKDRLLTAPVLYGRSSCVLGCVVNFCDL